MKGWMRAGIAALAASAVPAWGEEPLPAYAHRNRDREEMLTRGGGDAATEAAVQDGLSWLARHQSPRGSWNPETFADAAGDCGCAGSGEPEHAVGVTGLALLAFAGAGHGSDSRREWKDPVTGETVRVGEHVRRGLAWLAGTQRQSGQFDGGGNRLMYSHAMATAAMCEHYGLTGDAEWKRSAEAGIGFLLAARNPGGAWRYTSRAGDNDVSVTSWCVQALHAARLGEIGDRVQVDAALTGARSFVRACTDERTFLVGYHARGDGKVITTGKNEEWEGHPAMTAAGMVIRLRAGEARESRPIVAGAKVLVSDLPVAAGKKIDAYYWYCWAQGLYLCKGPTSKYWNRGRTGR